MKTRGTKRNTHTGRVAGVCNPRFAVGAGAFAVAALLTLTWAPRPAAACGGGPYDEPASLSKAGKRWAVKMTFRTHGHQFRYGKKGVSGVTIFTKDKRFARFLVAEGRGGGVWGIIGNTASKFTAKVVWVGSELMRFERTIARKLVRAYLKQKKRWTRTPDLMIDAS